MNYENKTLSQITPYTAGEQPQDKKYVKLNTNENPYPPSEKINEFLKSYELSDLKLYPDMNCTILREAIAKVHNLKAENVFIGNGSDEILAMVFGTFFERGKQVAFADITYSFYKVYTQLFGIEKFIIPISEDFAINPQDYLNLNTNGIVVANPNAPTGKVLSVCEIEQIVKENQDKVVVIDEAYVDFCDQTSVKLIEKYKNILVVKTFSKSYSLAGIRCGFALGDASLIHSLEKFKDSFNSYPIDRICQRICTIAVNDQEYHKETVEKIVKTRSRMTSQLEELGFKVIPSGSNFVFATTEKMQAEQLYLKLKENGVLVRYFKAPRIDNYLRITVGSDEEVDVLIAKIKQVLGE